MRYRQRNVVERVVARLKQYRAIATRYDKLAVCYLAWLVPAARQARAGGGDRPSVTVAA